MDETSASNATFAVPDGVRGVVFDFGGVISVSPIDAIWPRTVFPFCEARGVSKADVLRGFARYRRFWDGDLWTFGEMWTRVFADAGRPLSEDDVRTLETLDPPSWCETMRDDTLRLMETLRARGMKIGLLTNMSTGFFETLFAPRCAAYRTFFDVEVVSGLVGLSKPNAAVYELTASRMGLTPRELLFLDDTEVNVRGAEACGWHARLYR